MPIAWALSRLIVLAAALAVQLLGWPSDARVPFVRRPFALLVTWDGNWYRIIASRGYFLLPGHSGSYSFFPQSDPAFFPLLPLGLRGLHALGLPTNLAGLLLTNVCFLIGLIGFQLLGQSFLSPADARRAAVYAAFFPFGFVYSMLYPEALVFALITFALLFALRDQWLASALCASLAALGRPQGLLLVFPLGALAYSHWPALRSRSRAVAVGAVLAPVVALAAFSVALWWRTGELLAWSEAQRGWGRSFSPLGPVTAVHQLVLLQHRSDIWLFRDVAFLAVYILSLVLAWRGGVPRSLVIAGLLMLALPLASGSFTSEARYGLLALPVFWGLGIAGRRRMVNRVVMVASPLLLAVGTATILMRWP